MSPRPFTTTGLLAALALTLTPLAALPASAANDPAPTNPTAPVARTAGDVAGPGQWRVTQLDGHTYRLTWRSDKRLPVGADRPVIEQNGTPVGVTTVAADGRTVEATVTASSEPQVADLDVRLSERILDTTSTAPPALTSEPAAAMATATADTVLPDDPAKVGPYKVTRSNYQLAAVPVAGMAQPIEMVGHVSEPVAGAKTGPRPLVLFLHGRHSYCYNPGDDDDSDSEWPCASPSKEIPSQLGYRYLQDRLASQGFTTVSIRVNGINAQDYALADDGAAARALIVQRHLDYWASIAAGKKVDMQRVVLIGHSRGGEGVARASIQIPLSAPYRVVGQVLIAPTDFGSQTAPYIPTVTFLPSCDGDVMDLQGQRYTDISRGLLPDDTSLKSSVMMVGANHNWFNTEWTEGISAAPSWDDWWGQPKATCGTKDPKRLSDKAQRDVALTYVTGAVRLFARGETQYLPLFDGSPVRAASAGKAIVRTHALGGGRQVLRPGSELKVAASTGKMSICTGTLETKAKSCGFAVSSYESAPHWYATDWLQPLPQKGLDFSWTAAGKTGSFATSSPVDVRGKQLALRTVVDQRYGGVTFKMRLYDTTGARAEVPLSNDGRIERIPGGVDLGKWWAQTLVANPSGAKIKLAKVTRIELVPTTKVGRVIILDAALSAPTLAAVPQNRSPLVNVGSLDVVEGNGTTPVTLQVPVTLTKAATKPVKLRYQVMGILDDHAVVQSITIPAGQTTGSIPVTYQPNKVYDYDTETWVQVMTDADAMTDNYVGTVTIHDDDPVPTVKIEAVSATVKEGNNARVKITLSAPVGFDTYVDAYFASAKAPFATAGDLPASFFDSPQKPGTALWRTDQWMWDYLPAGERTLEVRVPTRADKVKEDPERMKLHVSYWLNDEPIEKDVVFTIVDP